jgi:hypothetical protein
MPPQRPSLRVETETVNQPKKEDCMNRLLVLFATASVMVGCGRAVSPTPLSAPLPDNAATYLLTGRVLDAGDALGGSLGGVKIEVSNASGHHEAFTDADGFYSVDALGAGTWAVNVTKPGYLAQAARLDVYGDTSMDFQLERAVPGTPSGPEGTRTKK